MSSCGHREYILNGKKLDELRLVEYKGGDNIWLTTDPRTINELKSIVYYIDNEGCHWTTPDGVIELFRKGKEIKNYGFCYGYQTNLDNLKSKLHKTVKHIIEFESKKDWQEKLNQLYSDTRVRLDYISPDSISIKGLGLLNIDIIDTTKEEEKIHTDKLRKLFMDLYGLNENDFLVKAWSYSHDTIIYGVSIRCDKNWSDKFEANKLKLNQLTSKYEIYEYERDIYKIIYRDWSE